MAYFDYVFMVQQDKLFQETLFVNVVPRGFQNPQRIREISLIFNERRK